MSIWYRARWQGKRPHGYWDMGGIQIPPLPPRHILTDRDDGTLWLLSHNADFDHVAITDSFTAEPGRDLVWGPIDGPWVYLTGTPLRLFVRGQRLGYERVEDPALSTQSQARILTNRAGETTYIEIVVPSTWRTFPDPLGAEYPA